MAAPAWSAGVMGAYELSSMAGKMGQIVQRLCRVQFWHVPFYAACYTACPDTKNTAFTLMYMLVMIFN